MDLIFKFLPLLIVLLLQIGLPVCVFVVGMQLWSKSGERAFKFTKWILLVTIVCALVAILFMSVLTSIMPFGAVFLVFGLPMVAILVPAFVLVGLLFAGIVFQRWQSLRNVDRRGLPTN